MRHDSERLSFTAGACNAVLLLSLLCLTFCVVRSQASWDTLAKSFHLTVELIPKVFKRLPDQTAPSAQHYLLASCLLFATAVRKKENLGTQVGASVSLSRDGIMAWSCCSNDNAHVCLTRRSKPSETAV